MWLRGRLLSCVGLVLVLPVQGEAQERLPLFERAVPKAVTAAVSSSSPGATQASGPRSGGRDSLLNGTVIGLAVGAALGLAIVYAVRDSDLDAGQYAYGALIFGGIGAGVGLGVDALFDRRSSVVVRSPRRAALYPRVIMRW